jgi:hypothetical protein
MKRVAIFLTALAFAALLILLSISKTRGRSGPGIGGNLHSLQLAKDTWLADGHSNEWPTLEDLAPYWTGVKLLNDKYRYHGEVYFVNRTGAPPFAYVPEADGPYRGGEVLVLTPNGLLRRSR